MEIKELLNCVDETIDLNKEGMDYSKLGESYVHTQNILIDKYKQETYDLLKNYLLEKHYNIVEINIADEQDVKNFPIVNCNLFGNGFWGLKETERDVLNKNDNTVFLIKGMEKESIYRRGILDIIRQRCVEIAEKKGADKVFLKNLVLSVVFVGDMGRDMYCLRTMDGKDQFVGFHDGIEWLSFSFNKKLTLFNMFFTGEEKW